jgi:hypothetical protein
MTTIIPFIPSNLLAPRFDVVLDGNNYNVVVTWNISAQRYYVNVYGIDGSWIITTPLVQSPPARAVNSFAYDTIRRIAMVSFVDPSLWPIPLSSAGTLTAPGTMVDYTLENFDPLVLNATWRSLHIDSTNFSFQLADNPGTINILGSVSRYLNMVGGIFQSTLIYRNGSFEVNP